jgi:hypothetical protein
MHAVLSFAALCHAVGCAFAACHVLAAEQAENAELNAILDPLGVAQLKALVDELKQMEITNKVETEQALADRDGFRRQIGNLVSGLVSSLVSLLVSSLVSSPVSSLVSLLVSLLVPSLVSSPVLSLVSSRR